MKIRGSIVAALVPLLLLAALGAWELHWRTGHARLQPEASAPDAAHVAEVRSLPDSQVHATGVYLVGRHAWLRSLAPRLVFRGNCEQVDTRWFGSHRLVITCALRAGEPQLLESVVDGVAIEVVVDRQFALASASRPA